MYVQPPPADPHHNIKEVERSVRTWSFWTGHCWLCESVTSLNVREKWFKKEENIPDTRRDLHVNRSLLSAAQALQCFCGL